jgi:hypothetical protein
MAVGKMLSRNRLFIPQTCQTVLREAILRHSAWSPVACGWEDIISFARSKYVVFWGLDRERELRNHENYAWTLNSKLGISTPRARKPPAQLILERIYSLHPWIFEVFLFALGWRPPRQVNLLSAVMPACYLRFEHFDNIFWQRRRRWMRYSCWTKKTCGWSEVHLLSLRNLSTPMFLNSHFATELL